MPIIGPFPTYKAPGAFKFSVLTTAPNETFTLPLLAGEHSFSVDWGDSSSDIIRAYDASEITHNYVSAGTHTITMFGNCFGFAFNDAGDKLKVVELLEFHNDMGFTVLNFQGCANLTTIPSSMKNLKSLTTAENMFYDCASLTAIPAGIFDGGTKITSFWGVFRGCLLVTSIPANLFDKNTLVINMGDVFDRMLLLTTIPADLFKYNTEVTSFLYTFFGCSGITSYPVDLFKYNTKVTDFSGTFVNNTYLSVLPVDLFRYNTEALWFSGLFTSCSALTTVSADLFKYNTKATAFNSVFYESGLTSIPAELFRYNTLAQSFQAAFYRCQSLQISTDIFWGAGERDTRFLNQSVDFRGCFYEDSFLGVQGAAPDLWNCDFGTGTPATTDCFGGAGNSIARMTNYGYVPVAWGGTPHTSQYPPVQSETYVKATTYIAGPTQYVPWNATDPAKSLVGASVYNAWASATGSPQRFHIDLGSAKIIKRVYYENLREASVPEPDGTSADVKNFTLWGSNDSDDFADLVYANDGTWTQLTTDVSAFVRHSAIDQSEPQYVVVTNVTAYQYYAFKFADTYGNLLTLAVRRIELQD
jgi:hypothetical protein